MDLEKSIRREISTQEKKEDICKMIIKEVEKIYFTSFDVEQNRLTYEEMVQFLLLYPKFEFYHSYTSFLLIKYGVKKSALIFRLINLLQQREIPEFLQKDIEEELVKLPYFKGIEKENNECIISTVLGSIKTKKIQDFVDPETMNFFNNLSFQGNSHECVQILSEQFQEGMVVTSEFPDLFSGTFCHSYFLIGDWALDFLHNTCYEKNILENIFKEKEIRRLPASEFHQKVKTLK